jgi:hypothetical protein
MCVKVISWLHVPHKVFPDVVQIRCGKLPIKNVGQFWFSATAINQEAPVAARSPDLQILWYQGECETGFCNNVGFRRNAGDQRLNELKGALVTWLNAAWAGDRNPSVVVPRSVLDFRCEGYTSSGFRQIWWVIICWMEVVKPQPFRVWNLIRRRSPSSLGANLLFRPILSLRATSHKEAALQMGD